MKENEKGEKRREIVPREKKGTQRRETIQRNDGEQSVVVGKEREND